MVTFLLKKQRSKLIHKNLKIKFIDKRKKKKKTHTFAKIVKFVIPFMPFISLIFK